MKKTRLVVFILLALLLVITSAAWAAPAEAAPAAKKAACGSCKYRVKRGDTLYSIGIRYGVSVKTLKRCNGIKNANRIYVGWKLTVPCKKVVKQPKRPPKRPPVRPPTGRVQNCRLLYVVRPGDSLSAIANYTCSTVEALAHRNRIRNPSRIYSWQKLCVPIRPYWCR